MTRTVNTDEGKGMNSEGSGFSRLMRFCRRPVLEFTPAT